MTTPTPPLLREVEVVLFRAVRQWPPMHSPHEGWAVIREELEELWKHVIADTGRGLAARQEAMHVSAMGLRYAMDLCVEESA